MSITAAITFAALSAAPLQAVPSAQDVHLAQAQQVVSTQGSAVQGDYMTTAKGCTYRRTKAPGYPERWVLVLNPHHLGLPNSPRGCKGMM